MAGAIKLRSRPYGIARNGNALDRIGIEERVAEDAESERKAANFLAFAIGSNTVVR